MIRDDKLLMYPLLSLFPARGVAPEKILLKSNLISCSGLLSSGHNNSLNFTYFTLKVIISY